MTISTEKAVTSILGAAHIYFDILPRGVEQNALGGDTDMDKWEVTFSNIYGCNQQFYYFTGKGLRKFNTPVKPHIAGVLYSLITDAEALQYNTFEEWASYCGYDADSRRAEKIYHACRENGEKLHKILPAKTIDILAEVLRNY